MDVCTGRPIIPLLAICSLAEMQSESATEGVHQTSACTYRDTPTSEGGARAGIPAAMCMTGEASPLENKRRSIAVDAAGST